MGTRDKRPTTVFEVTKVVTVRHDKNASEEFLRDLAARTPIDCFGCHVDHGPYSAQTTPEPVRIKRIRSV